ncbi:MULTISPECIES: extracellular solute-binding protein [Blautia]|uniref:extracellular solute-binding protein n=1 Tax=Blautia TaxID=572511 RepID=UPI000BA44B26|nr:MULTISPECIES: extracellular solute-binding protein [Blautia]
MRRKAISLLLATTLAAVLLSGCGEESGETSNTTKNNTVEEESEEDAILNNTAGSSEEGQEGKPEKLVVVISSEGTGPMEKTIEQFTNETGIEIELISEAYDNVHNKIMTMVAGGSQCDIVCLDTVWPAEFAKSNLILPVDDYLETGFGDKFTDISWKQLQYDGHQYGIPTGNDAKWLFYNKEILEKAGYKEPPKTWQELGEMSLKMKEEGLVKYGIAWGASQAEGLVCDYTALLYGFGGQYREDDENSSGDWKLNSEESIEALTWFRDSMENGIADPASTTYTDRNVMNTFMAGDVAFVTGWSSYWTATNSETESAIAGKVGMTMLPGSEKVKSGSVAGGGGYAVVSTTKSTKWAVEFLKLLTEPEIQKSFLEGVSQMPTLKELYKDEELTSKFEILDMAYPQYEYAHFRPILVQYQNWSNMVQESIHKVIANGEDPSTVLDSLQQNVTSQIQN